MVTKYIEIESVREQDTSGREEMKMLGWLSRSPTSGLSHCCEG